MKKAILIMSIMVLGFTADAQKSNLGVSFGLPVASTSDYYEYSTMIEWNLLYEVTETIDIGGGVGFIHTSGPSLTGRVGNSNTIFTRDINNLYLPISVNGRWAFSKKFTLGLDVGYAFSLDTKVTDGGLYLAPKLQYEITDKLSLMLALRSISLNNSNISIDINDNRFNTMDYFQSFSFGLEFKL